MSKIISRLGLERPVNRGGNISPTVLVSAVKTGINDGYFSTLAFNSGEINQDTGGFWSAADDDKFFAPYEGIYHVTLRCAVAVPGSAPTTGSLQIFTEAPVFGINQAINWYGTFDVVAGTPSFGAGGALFLRPGDYITLFVDNQLDVTVDLYPVFSMSLIV